MIYDRTEYDVSQAKKIRDEKVKTFQELTEEEIRILERGFVTIRTICRIEEKQIELRRAFNEAGYYNTEISSKSWADGEIFYYGDLVRLIKNNNILRDAFYILTEEIGKPKARYHYEDVNKIEKILHELEVAVTDMTRRYRRCGTFNCGG